MTDSPLTAETKADFSAIYSGPDPRAYYRALQPLDYQVPAHALPVVEGVLDGRPVLDLCCSYGTNAALLRTSVDLAGLTARYTDPALADLSPVELADADAAFFAAHRRRDVRMLGLDASGPAVTYAGRAGLLDAAFAEDLETGDPSPALAAALADVGTIVCTGGVGYVGPATFTRLLAHVPPDVRLVVFVLRVFAYDAIAEVVAAHGLTTQKRPGTVRQRRFADTAEQAAAVADVAARGLDPEGREAAGWFHAECFVSIPRPGTG